MYRRTPTLTTKKTGTAAALGRARDLLTDRGMHSRASALQALSELVWKRRSQQHILTSRLSTRLQQARPSGTRRSL